MSIFAAFVERFIESQPQVDAARRRDAAATFSAASARLQRDAAPGWAPTNAGFQGHRRFPNMVIENWAAAWKVRRHYEDQTELRKAQGKAVY